MPVQPSRPRGKVVAVLQDRLERAREAAEGKGMPRDAPWPVPVIQPEVGQFGGAEAVRSAARAAARKAGIKVHTYATCRADNAAEQMVVIGNRGALPQPRTAREPDPRWPAFTLNPDAGPGHECDCGNEPCLSAGLDRAAHERWLIADWYSLTPLTDLRTLPAEQRSRERDALFARNRAHSWDDRILDLNLFRDGSMELGPLGDVQVYATNPHGRYKSRSHGVGCRYAEYLQRIMKRHDPAIYPGEYVTCVHAAPTALCEKAKRGRGEGLPDHGGCLPLACRNVALTPENARVWQRELGRIERRLAARPPLPPRLRARQIARHGEIAEFLTSNGIPAVAA